MDELSARIRDIIAVELQVDPERVVADALLRADLGMDSIAALNILFATEETFGLPTIDVRNLGEVATVRDAEGMIRRLVAAHRA